MRDYEIEDPPLNGHYFLPIAPIEVTEIKPAPLWFELGVDEVASYQRLYCRHRGICLRIADNASWKSFSCNDCPGFAALTPAEISEETDALLHLLAVSRDLERKDEERR